MIRWSICPQDSFDRRKRKTCYGWGCLCTRHLHRIITAPTCCKALNCVDTWPQRRQSVISQLRGLTEHSICWWMRKTHSGWWNREICQEASISSLLRLFEIFPPSLASFPGRLLLQMHARCTSPPSPPSEAVGFFSPQPERAENRSEGGEEGDGEEEGRGGGSQAWTRLYDFQHDLHNCMHLMQREYTVPAWMISSYLQTAP